MALLSRILALTLLTSIFEYAMLVGNRWMAVFLVPDIGNPITGQGLNIDTQTHDYS